MESRTSELTRLPIHAAKRYQRLKWATVRLLWAMRELIYRRIVRIPLERCVNPLAFSYANAGWHYYSAFLREMDSSQGDHQSEMLLHRFYELYQPGAFPSFMFANDYPRSNGRSELEQPWLECQSIDHTSDDVHQCGPRSAEAIRADIEQVRFLYEKIKVEGYKPLRYPDGFIRGIFLVRQSGDWRFLVTAGQHRCAVLSHLGVESAWAWLQPGYPPYVREIEAEQWPQVRSGRWSEADALKRFELMFSLNGVERAELMGLLSQRNSL